MARQVILAHMEHFESAFCTCGTFWFLVPLLTSAFLHMWNILNLHFCTCGTFCFLVPLLTSAFLHIWNILNLHFCTCGTFYF